MREQKSQFTKSGSEIYAGRNVVVAAVSAAASAIYIMNNRSNAPIPAIFWGGLLAGIGDLTQAFIGFGLMGATPFRILQGVARGIFGGPAREMGWTSATVGLSCHFTIAFTAAAIYYLISRKLRVLVEHPIVAGLVYGELVFLFMYFVVLPVSAIGPPHFNLATYITGPIGHPILVGLPIALCVRRYSR